MTESGLSQSIGLSGKAGSDKRKTALVVDDSKLARYVLKEMLIEQGIKVETAESAEEALGSLSAYMPDVIFMDHMMPGMDGFQAVQAIKNDPKTAKIPILMYTSKDEGVYVNQARALGAVGVLPKKLKPVQLERVLQQLNLIPSFQASKEEPKPSPDVQAKQERIIKETQHSLEELARSASEDLEKDSMRQLFRQLFIEQRDTIKQDQNQLLEAMVKQVQPTIQAMSKSNKRWQRLSGVLFLLLIAPLYYLMPDMSSVNVALDEIKQSQMNQGALFKQEINRLNIPSPENSEFVHDWSTVQWALNQNNQLSYLDSVNLSVTISRLSELGRRLNDGLFQGTLFVRFHEGNFCESGSGTTRMLAKDATPLNQCSFRKDALNQNSQLAQELRASIQQLNDQYQNIDVRFEEMGFEFTLQDYPFPSVDVTAKEWNRIAAYNHRLQFELVSQ